MELPEVYCRALSRLELCALPPHLLRFAGSKTGLALLGRAHPTSLGRHLPETLLWRSVSGEQTEEGARAEWTAFWAALEVGDGRERFAIKIDGTSRGRGVYMVSRAADVDSSLRLRLLRSACVAQRYVERPSLLDGRKWDMRVYALLVVDGRSGEARAFRYEEGFARVCREAFASAPLSSRKAHVTNTSVNNALGDPDLVEYAREIRDALLTSADPARAALFAPQLLMDDEDLEQAIRLVRESRLADADDCDAEHAQLPVTMRLSEAWARLAEERGQEAVHVAREAVHEVVSDLFRAICVPAGTLDDGRAVMRLAAHHMNPALAPTAGLHSHRHAMLLGIDVLLDDSMKPFLLEVNRFPDMHCYSRAQVQVKQALLRDALSLVFPNADAASTMLDAVHAAGALDDVWAALNPSLDAQEEAAARLDDGLRVGAAEIGAWAEVYLPTL